MQGYGPRRSSPARLLTVVVLLVLAVTGLASCSLASDPKPSQIVLPPTDDISTDSVVPTTSEAADPTDENTVSLPSWSIGRVIARAPREDNSLFRRGATAPDSPTQDSSGFHFSTPDRRTSCSTGTNGTSTLVCRVDRDVAQPIPRPSLEPSSCRWSSTLVVLDSNGPERGACANRYPVLYRSAVVEYGNTITVSRFSCLSESVGLYCIESGSRSGFAITSTGYRAIDAEDRAPSSLLGGAAGDSTDDPMNRTDEPSDTDSDSVPTS